jgi:hypothetical protein
LRGEIDSDEALEILLGKLIKQALAQTNGSIPDAPSLLTLTPEHLTIILELRHKDLLASAARDSDRGRADLQFSPVTLHDAA